MFNLAQLAYIKRLHDIGGPHAAFHGYYGIDATSDIIENFIIAFHIAYNSNFGTTF